MTTRAERLAIVNAALKRQANEVARERRDERQAQTVKVAARTASPAGLISLFPGLSVTATKKG